MRYSRTGAQTPVWVTAQALIALAARPFPIAAVQPFSGALAFPLACYAMSAHAYTAEAVQPQRVSARRWAAGPAAPLGVAALCLLGLGAGVADRRPRAGRALRDALALHDFTCSSRPGVEKVGTFLLHLLEPRCS